MFRWFLERLNNIVKGANDLKSTGKLADVDDDGQVDGADLGLLLGGWGFCP